MTREEEIKLVASCHIAASNEDFKEYYEGFIEGAKWADENPNLYNDEKYHTVRVSCLDELNRKAVLYDTFLEKACDWLQREMLIRRYIDMNAFINDFKKAMEL